jgi:cytochrome b561
MSGGDRYTRVAIVLHWLIAIAIIGLLAVGLTMTEKDFYPQDVQFQLFQLHKSMGLTVLVLSVLRLLWRLLHKPPPLPAEMQAWEVFAAKATHWVFYGLMFVIPLTGWAMVSTSSWGLPTYWFGLFEWPHLPLQNLSSKEGINEGAGNAHEFFSYLLIALLALHIGAAVKHYIWNRDNVVSHMIPILKPLGPRK